MNDVQDQWQRREGYDGPESFPEDGLAEFAIGPTACLAGRDVTVSLAGGDVLNYVFHDHAELTLTDSGGTPSLSTARVRVCAGGSASRMMLGGRHGFSFAKSLKPTPRPDDGAPDATLIVDQRGVVVYANERGDRVMLVSENRPEWLIADLGIMAAGCVTVRPTPPTPPAITSISSATRARGR